MTNAGVKMSTLIRPLIQYCDLFKKVVVEKTKFTKQSLKLQFINYILGKHFLGQLFV